MESGTQTGKIPRKRPKLRTYVPDWPRLVQRSVAFDFSQLQRAIVIPRVFAPPPSRFARDKSFGEWSGDSSEVSADLLYVSVDRGRKATPKSPQRFQTRNHTAVSRLRRPIHSRPPAPDLGKRLEFQTLRERLRRQVLSLPL